MKGRLASLKVAYAHLRKRPVAWAGAIAILVFGFAALFANVLASDLPLLARVHGRIYLLPCLVRPAALEPRDEIERLHEHPASDEWAINPPIPYSADRPRGDDAASPFAPPSQRHWLGTDALGRDVASRLVHGARTAAGVALVGVTLAVAIGAVGGGIAGFFGGVFDAFLARGVETLSAFPTLILVLVIQAILRRPSFSVLLVGIALTRWPEVTRLVRAEVLVVRGNDYVLAARALGASSVRILWNHVIPNVKAPIMVAATLAIAQVVLLEASLSFLHVGAPPGAASWGEMMAEVRGHPSAWWLLVFPGVSLGLVAAAFNVVGEALRDLTDPRLRTEALEPAFQRAPDPNRPTPDDGAPPSTRAPR